MSSSLLAVAAAAGAACVSAAAPAGLSVTEETTLPRTTINGDEYTATPNGYMLSHCVFEVPHGAESRRNQDSGEVTVVASARDGGGVLATLPQCLPRVSAANPVLLARKENVAAQPNPLPPDYDGWLQYTAFHDETPGATFDVFTSTMSVPDTPKALPQILYLFPGLQNIDWIPKHDPEPKTPFDIIQPVLQFPFLSGDKAPNGRDWGVRSWYVTVDVGALVSPEKLVAPGDSIGCNMTRTGKDSWFIGSKITSSGEETNQKATATRLTSQPWAYNTVECYGCKGCDTYPEKVFSVTDIAISSFASGPASVTWEANPKPAAKLMCHENVTIVSAQEVDFSFQ